MANDIAIYQAEPVAAFDGWDASKWKEYIFEATLDEFSAIIEKGRRIREFWEVYWTDRDRWGKDWGDACYKTIGLKQSTCSRYMHIYRVFSSRRHWLDSSRSLPADITCLDFLARAIMADEKFARQSLLDRRIHPDMSKEDAGLICSRAQLEQETYIKTRIQEGAKDEEIMEEANVDIKRLNYIRKRIFEAEAEQSMEGPDVAKEVKDPKKETSLYDPPPAVARVEKPPVAVPAKQELLLPLPPKVYHYPDEAVMTPHMMVCRELDKLASKFGFRSVCNSIELWMEDRTSEGDHVTSDGSSFEEQDNRTG